MNQSLIFQPPNSYSEREELSNLVDNLSSVNDLAIVIDGQNIKMPSVVAVALLEMIKNLNQGNSITLIPMDKELTTQQAADILNVSRPYFIKLLENGELPFKKVGTHRKICMRDLIEYKEKRDNTRREKIQELSELSQDLGLYD